MAGPTIDRYVRLSPENYSSSVGIMLLIWLSVLTALLCVFLAGLFVPIGSVLAITGVIAASAAVLMRWPHGAIFALIASSVMPRFSLALWGANVRPEHVVVGLVAGVLLLRWLLSRPKLRPRFVTLDYYLLAYLAWNYISSLLMSPDPRLTLRWALLNNLAVLPYFLLRALVVDERVLRWALRIFLTIGIAECTYALVCFVSSHVLGTSFGVEVGQYVEGFGGIYGTQYEPNLLGSYSACIAVMLLVLYFLSDRRANWLARGAILAISAMVASLARAPVLAFVIVLVLLSFWAVRARVLRPRRLFVILACLLVLFTPFALTAGKNLAQRFTTLDEGTVQADVDATGRLVSWVVAIQDISQHPIAGNGTASFQLLADSRQVPILGDRPWVGNSLLRILHDNGLIGLILFGLVVAAIGKWVWKSVRHGAQGKEIIIALFAGCLVYAIAFLSTDGTMLAFFWVHVGLLVSSCAVDREKLNAKAWANV